uniref:C-type lectin n=1 Tax=Phalotris mertensi TaxID=1260334 RepID=A0A182C5T2_9SAUR
MLLITCFIFGLLGSLTWAGPHGRTTCPCDTFAYKEESEWNCYKFYEAELTFDDAEEECKNTWKGHLASFNSNEQSKSLADYVIKENIKRHFVWIGLQRDVGSHKFSGWYWIDESPSNYRRWSMDEPDNRFYHQYCSGLDPRYGLVTWADLTCTYKLPFLCKWNPA